MGHPVTTEILAMVISLLTGIIVGLLSGILARIGGSSWPVAIREGSIAFAGWLTLSILVLASVGALR